jgi:hypothetical protein
MAIVYGKLSRDHLTALSSHNGDCVIYAGEKCWDAFSVPKEFIEVYEDAPIGLSPGFLPTVIAEVR